MTRQTLSDLQKKDLSLLASRLKSSATTVEKIILKQNELKGKVRDTAMARDEVLGKGIAENGAECDAREAYMNDCHDWRNIMSQKIHQLEMEISDIHTIMPSLQSEVFQYGVQIEENDKVIMENFKETAECLKAENKLALQKFQHEDRLREHKNQLEQLKVAMSQIGLLLRLNTSTKNEYKRKMAEMEMKRDDIGIDVEKQEEEIKKLAQELRENQERLHEVECKLNDQRVDVFHKNKQAYTLKQQLMQKQNVLLHQHNKEKAIVGILTSLKKQKEATEMESKRLLQLVESICKEKESKQKEVDDLHKSIEESAETLKLEEHKRAEMQSQLVKSSDELKALEVEMHDTRKTLDSWKLKGKKSKQAFNQAERNLQVRTRKFTVAQEATQKQKQVLKKEQDEHQQYTSQLQTTPKSDRKTILQIRGKLGSLEFRIEQLEKDVERLEEEERTRNNDFIIATLEVKNRKKEYEEVDARVQEAIANNAILIKKQTELKKHIETDKSKLSEQQKIVEDFKKRSTGGITLSKVEQLNLSLREINARSVSSQIKVSYIELKQRHLEESKVYWDEKLALWETRCTETQKLIDKIRVDLKESIRVAAQKKIELEATEKNDYHKRLHNTQASHKQLGLSRSRLEGLLILQQRFTALCKYFPWADESESSKDTTHTIEDLRREYSKVENDIEEEKQHLQTYKEVLKRDVMDIDQVNRTKKQMQLNTATDEDQRKHTEQQHKLQILQETLEALTSEMRFHEKQDADVNKHAEMCRLKSKESNKKLLQSQHEVDNLTNQMQQSENDLQQVEDELTTLNREISSSRDKQEVMLRKEHQIQQKLAALNADLRYATEEKTSIEQKLKEIDSSKPL